MTRAALWVRVSTDTQEVANQRLALETEARRRGWGVVRVYEVVASAARGHHAPALAQALEDARRGVYQVLLTTALDRLSRGGIGDLFRTWERFARAGVDIVSLAEPWTAELSGPLRDLMLAVAGFIGAWEAQRIRERTLAGLERARRAGRRIGRPPVMGWVDLDLVAKLRAAGASWRAIARQHPPTVPTPRSGRKRPSVDTIRRAWQKTQNGLPTPVGGEPTEAGA